ncbi:MAG: inositol 2-dehydrogenase [Bauldia sp.]|nr:MAG: inositol 2-dehydrogenase [Bauldia sp.]
MTIRVGLIGAGVMGADHARILSTAVSGAELAAVSDADAGRMAAVAESRGARAIADPEALIGDPAVDAVIVASPDHTHSAMVHACLAAGKPVLCEKPLAPTTTECLDIVARESKLGRRLVQVGFMRRFDPGYVAMRRQLDSGELGAALVLHCIHRNSVGGPALKSEHLIVGSAVHEFDIARWLLGEEVRHVTVIRPRRTAATEAQDPQIILLQMESGAIVDIEVFVDAQYGYDVRGELVGEKGTVSLTPPRDSLLRQARREAVALPVDWRPRFAEAYAVELQGWIASINNGVPAGASAWDGYVATAVADAGVKSLTGGGSVEVRLEPRPGLYG